MEYPHCENFGFDESAIQKRLNLLELGEQDLKITGILQGEVIGPNVKQIVGQFYDDYLLHYEDYKRVIGTPQRIAPLKKSQMQYLLTLGINFNTRDYFENRLRVGVAHNRVGLSLSLYECAYFKLRALICDSIETLDEPHKIHTLQNFVSKIISLDMSLAIESFHRGKAGKLELFVKNLKDQQAILQKKADTDYLTHFSTREAVLARLEVELTNFKQGGKSFSVIMVDLDDLGKVNDQYGHLIGDHVMREIAMRLQKMVSKSDTIGRYGGDEFLILLPALAKEQAQKFAEQLRGAISNQPLSMRNIEVKLAASIGVCDAESTDTMASLFAKVDKALFAAKKDGGNKVVVYT